jgi:hypothetical protein
LGQVQAIPGCCSSGLCIVGYPRGEARSATGEGQLGAIRRPWTMMGIGSTLIRKDLVTAGDFAAIGDNLRQVLAWIREAREGEMARSAAGKAVVFSGYAARARL